MGIEILNDMINQLDIIDIHRTFYLKTEDYTFIFKCTWDICQSILVLEVWSNFTELKLYSTCFLITVELITTQEQKITIKAPNVWRLIKTFLNSPWIKMKSRWKLENVLIWKTTSITSELVECNWSSALRGLYCFIQARFVFIVLCFIALRRYCVSLQTEVYGNPAMSKFIGAICPTAFSHW